MRRPYSEIGVINGVDKLKLSSRCLFSRSGVLASLLMSYGVGAVVDAVVDAVKGGKMGEVDGEVDGDGVVVWLVSDVVVVLVFVEVGSETDVDLSMEVVGVR